MADSTKRTAPEEFVDENSPDTEGVVNDSLGTVNVADSTGSDEEKETGDAKVGNKDPKPQD
jgi:hypothetical protein